MAKRIDVGFSYRTDCAPKQDPDKYSRRLKDDHCFLWSKPVQNNPLLNLLFYVKNNIIYCDINGRTFDFAPDSITNCFTYWDKMKDLREKDGIKELIEEYKSIDYTIGSSIIFPVGDDNGSSTWTINKARGCSRMICDRIDYTLECIRLFYLDKNADSPLKSCLNRYNFFFDLFDSFENYVKFFLLDDLVTKDYKQVISFTGSIDFKHPLPTEENYAQYIKATIQFLTARNRRIDKYANK